MEARAVVLWTGGKDSFLALMRARESGMDVVGLATFVPEHGPDFVAHPIDAMRRQAARLGLLHELLPIREPYRQSYVRALAELERRGIDAVITGDIDYVDSKPNWIAVCCAEAGLAAIRPLWQNDRERLLRELLRRKIEAVVTYVDESRLSPRFLNRTIDDEFIADIKAESQRTGADLCGENGEYHTSVVRWNG